MIGGSVLSASAIQYPFTSPSEVEIAMDRAALLRQMREAKTPNELATAISAVREWLREYPEDAEVQSAMIQLLLAEESSV